MDKEYIKADLLTKIYMDIKSCAEIRVLACVGVLVSIAYLLGLSTNLTLNFFDFAWLLTYIFLFILALVGISVILVILISISYAIVEWKSKSLKWAEVRKVYLNSEEYKIKEGGL